ncbi:MAG: hypothetical protein FH749_11565 [Firmicutes bacterium]|nr:hypothetical protein [Bacillota bacterium]
MKKLLIIAVLALAILAGCGSTAELPEIRQDALSEVFIFQSDLDADTTYIESEAVHQQLVSWYEESRRPQELNETLPGSYFQDDRAFNILVMKMGDEERLVLYALYTRDRDAVLYMEHFLGEGPEARRKSYQTSSQRLFNFIVELRELTGDGPVGEDMIADLAADIEARYSN